VPTVHPLRNSLYYYWAGRIINDILLLFYGIILSIETYGVPRWYQNGGTGQ